MAEGILIQVKGSIVQVDSKFYTVLDPKYVPKEVNIPVTFSVQKENPTVITFIKKTEDNPAPKKFYKKPLPKTASTTEEMELDVPMIPMKPVPYEKKTYGKSPEEQATIKAQAEGHMASRHLQGRVFASPEQEEAEIRRIYAIYKDLVG